MSKGRKMLFREFSNKFRRFILRVTPDRSKVSPERQRKFDEINRQIREFESIRQKQKGLRRQLKGPVRGGSSLQKSFNRFKLKRKIYKLQKEKEGKWDKYHKGEL